MQNWSLDSGSRSDAEMLGKHQIHAIGVQENMEEKERITAFLEDTFWTIDPARHRTRAAYEAVLMRLPDDILDAIVDEQAVLVFAPGSEWGHTYPYTLYPQVKPLPPVPSISDHVNAEGSQRYYSEAKTSVVYLSLQLESQEPAVVQAVIAHEIAHGIIRNIFGDESECQADSLVEEWGFGVELAALRAARSTDIRSRLRASVFL